MGVYRRSDNGQWTVEIQFTDVDGKKQRITRTKKGWTKKDAGKWERRALSALAEGTFGCKIKDNTPTLEEFADEFIQKFAKTDYSQSTYRGAEKNIRVHILPEFGSERLDKITAYDIAGFKAALIEKRSNRSSTGTLSKKTANNILSVLKVIFDKAVEWDYLVKAPKIELFRKVISRKTNSVTIEDAYRLIEAADEDMWRCMIAVAVMGGLRQGEVLDLYWRDVNWKECLLEVNSSYHRGDEKGPKNGESREVHSHPFAIEEIQRHREQTYLGEDGLIFHRDGVHLTDGMCRRPLERAFKNAGLPVMLWHALRHSCATIMAVSKAEPTVIQEQMGHADFRTTAKYIHLAEMQRREAVNAFNRPSTPTITQQNRGNHENG